MDKLDELLQTYLSSREIEERDELDWGAWAGENQPEGEAYWVDTDVYLRKTLAIRLLQLAAGRTDEELAQHVFPFEDQGISSLIDDGDHSLRKTYTEIERAPEKWEPLIPAVARAKIPSLLAAFDRTMAEKASLDRARVAAAPLSPAKVSNFICTVKEGFDDQAVFNSLARKFNFLKNSIQKIPSDKSVKAFGFNQVTPKEAFIENHPAYYDFGQDYGRGMARGEDRYGFRALTGALEPIGDTISRSEDISPALVEAYAKLNKSGTTATAIISSLDLEDTANLRQADRFTPTWAIKTTSDYPLGFIGLFNVSEDPKSPVPIEIPVFRLFLDEPKRSDPHGLCLVAIENIGEIVRLFPGEQEEDRPNIHDFIYCSIIDLNVNDEERARLLQANPKWLHEHEQEGKENYLRTRALLKIFQRTDFRFKKKAGLKILVSREAAPE